MPTDSAKVLLQQNDYLQEHFHVVAILTGLALLFLFVVLAHGAMAILQATPSPQRDTESDSLIDKTKFDEKKTKSHGNCCTEKTLLDEYNLGKMLGEGAFGVVYHCTRKGTNEEFAVKMIDKVESSLEVIQREAAMLVELKHENVVRLHDVYYEKVFVCMVLDIYKGGDMTEGMQTHWNSKGAIPADVLKNILKQMVAGIVFLHSQSVVHRDVKCDNYLMDRKDIADPECKIFLSDFGTVVTMTDGQRLHEKCGSKEYWSPEFYALNYAFKVDIWAIGVALYGLICGQFPFKSQRDVNTKQVCLPDSCPADLAKLVSNLLERDEKKRWAGHEILQHSVDRPKSYWRSVLRKSHVAIRRRRDDGPGPAEAPALDFKLEMMERGPNKNVGERRRELVARLENAAAKGEWSCANSQLVSPPFVDKVSKDAFEITDKTKGATTTFEWWPASKVIETGMLNLEKGTAASPELSGGSFEAIKILLQDHKIDTSKFGQGKAKSLEDFVNEVQAGSARLMLDATKHKSLVRVLDLVLLRLCYGDGSYRKFLIKQDLDIAEGRVQEGCTKFPGMTRQAHESSLETAKRIVKERLQFPDVEINFNIHNMETFEHEQESANYPGVRTVYRKSIVEATVSPTADVSRIGIADGKGIKTACPSGRRLSLDSDSTSREYKWMTESECTAKHIELRANQQKHKMSALVNAPVGFDEEQMVRLLQQGGVDIEHFGEAGAKSFEEFATELTNGEATLEKQADGIVRIIDVVAVKLTRKGGAILVEASEVKDGNEKDLRRLPAVKRRSDENQFLAAHRVLAKDLAMDNNEVTLNPDNVMVLTEQNDSPSYPGIKTIYRKHIISASIVQAAE